MMSTHPVLICTHCGNNLTEEFVKNLKVTKCVKCGNVKDVIEAMAENDRHEFLHQNKLNPNPSGVFSY